MKRLLSVLALLIATNALAVDAGMTCTGASCNIKMYPRNGSGTSFEAARFNPTGQLLINETSAVGSGPIEAKATATGSIDIISAVKNGGAQRLVQMRQDASNNGEIIVNDNTESTKLRLNTVGIVTNTTSNTGTSGATTTSNTLTSYEEGTWTPVVTASGTNFTSVTYSHQNGYFVRIGKIVLVSAYIFWSNTSGSPSGNLRITGFPFAATASSGINQSLAITETNNIISTSTTPVIDCTLNVGTTNCDFVGSGSSNVGVAATGISAAANGGAVARYVILQSTYISN